MFRGFWATFLRDVPTWGIYFGAYTKFKEWVTTENPLLRVIGTMHAAGMAGFFCWILSIPQDVIKNKQMTHIGESPLSMLTAYRELVAEGGMMRLTRGSGLLVSRGYVIGAIQLPIYDRIFA